MSTMYKRTTQKNAPNKNKTGYLSMLEDESLPRSDFLNIWRVNPSFRHIKQKRVLLRAIPILLFFNFLALISYYVFNNIFFSVGISIFATSGIFFEQLVNVFKKIFKLFHEITQVDPFEHFRICRLIEDSASILIINKKSATNVIVRVFQVDVLPENVQPTLNQFLKALNNSRLGFSYQVVQKPMIMLLKNDKKDEEHIKFEEYESVNSSESFKTSIYFSVFYHLDGALGKSKKWKLIETIEEYSRDLKSNFTANFHHTKITLLSGINLINAIRTLTYHQIVDVSSIKEDNLREQGFLIRILTKMMIVSILVVYISFALLFLNVNLLIVMIFDCLVIAFFILVWWRDILFVFTKIYLKRSIHISSINPFEDTEFYQVKSYKDIYFLNIQNRLLTAFSILNLSSSIQPTLAYPDKFFKQILMNPLANLCLFNIPKRILKKLLSKAFFIIRTFEEVSSPNSKKLLRLSSLMNL